MSTSHISVTSQYSDMGIAFNGPMAIDFSKNAVISGFAPHSGSIAILQCYTGRCYEPIEMKFDPAVSFIRVWMGFVTQAMGGFPRGTTGVVVNIFMMSVYLFKIKKPWLCSDKKPSSTSNSCIGSDDRLSRSTFHRPFITIYVHRPATPLSGKFVK
jgi:hypothetical protein